LSPWNIHYPRQRVYGVRLTHRARPV